MTIREYSDRVGTTYEAARKLVTRHSVDLEGHITKVGRTQHLDDEAVAMMDAWRNTSPVVQLQDGLAAEVEQLRAENKALLMQLAGVQAQLLKANDQIQQLQADKIALLEDPAPTPKRTFWQKFFSKD